MRMREIIIEASEPTVEVNGVRRPIHNSEGALIAATPDAQIAFWRWFGKSKIIDPHGRPLVVYRGDKLGKTEFTGREDPSSNIQGNIFFTNKRGVAMGYTPFRSKMYNPWFMDKVNTSHGLYSVYLKMVKPVIVDAKGEDWSRIPISGRLKKAIGWGKIQIDDLALYVQRSGKNDGLIVQDVLDQYGDGNQYVVFSSQQIKMV